MDRLLIGLAAIVAAMVLVLAWPAGQDSRPAGSEADSATNSPPPVALPASSPPQAPKHPVAAIRSSAAVRHLREARDWDEFLGKALEVGDAEHLYLADKLVQACWPFVFEGVDTALEGIQRNTGRDVPHYDERIERAKAMSERCRAFERSPRIREQLAAFGVQIANRPEPLVRAFKLRSTWTRETMRDSASEVLQLLESGDPFVLDELGSLLEYYRRGSAPGSWPWKELMQRQFAQRLETCSALALCDIPATGGEYRNELAGRALGIPRFVSLTEVYERFLTEEERTRITEYRRAYRDAFDRHDFSAFGLPPRADGR